MKLENKEKLQEIISDLEQLEQDIYDFDYDDVTIWNINNAIYRLKDIAR